MNDEQMQIALEGECQITQFQKSSIRRVVYKGEWWFSVVDVIGSLVDSKSPSRYWNELRPKLYEEGANKLFDKIEKLKMKAKDGKMRPTD